MRSTNPNVVINSRIQGYGDYSTPELGVPVVRPASRYWELCYTMNDSWGYQHQDTLFKTPQTLLRTFVECISMGGNLLLDIGPKEDGSIPEEEVAILKEFARWTGKHKEAIYETRAGIPENHFHGGYTALSTTGDVLYLYIPGKPNESVDIKGLVNKVKKVWVVGSGCELEHYLINDISWSEVPGILYINVPEKVLDEQITVIGVQLDGPIRLYRGEGQVISVND